MNKVIVEHLCKSCMSYLPYIGSSCPICGFDESQYFGGKECLRLGHILNKRYFVGKFIKQTNYEFYYIGWDFGLNCKIIIREYFPTDYFIRDNNSSNSIRIIAHQSASAKKFLELYYAEANSLMLLGKMDGIVNINDVFTSNGTCYIISDYFEHITLNDYIETVTEEVTIFHMLSMLQPTIYSLAVIHQRGIIHRCINEKNLIIDSTGKLFLQGFCVQNITNCQYTYLNDLQDICTIIYQILSGAKYHDNILSFKKTGVLLFPNNTPKCVKDVVLCCFNKDPSKMCTNMFDLYSKIYNNFNYENVIIPECNFDDNKLLQQKITSPDIVPLDPIPLKKVIFNLTFKDFITLFGIGLCAFALFLACRVIISMKLDSKVNSNNYNVSAAQEPIRWLDPNFESAIREILNNSRNEIYISDLENITSISLSDKNISRIDDITHFKSLTTLDLSNNNIDDITPLTQLTQLTEINLSNNMINDTSPLKKILSLKKVNLSYNPIKNWSGTTSIEYLIKTTN